jgi:ATP-dependent DNA helicase RecG
VLSQRVDEALAQILDGARPSTLEGQQLEFKRFPADVKAALRMIADAVVCLANGGGGSLVLGVEDDAPGKAALTGVPEAVAVHDVLKGVFDRTSPPISVPIEAHVIEGVRLLEVLVPAGAALYSTSEGTATRRVGDACRPFPPEQQRELLAARGLHDWSAAATTVAVDEVSDEGIAAVRRLLRLAGHDDLAAGRPAALLGDMHLLDATGHLTRAGLLLVGDPAQLRREIPQWGYQYQFRPSAGSEATARVRGRASLLRAAEDLIGAVVSRTSTRPLNTAGGVQLQMTDYAERAVRELIINALVHRSFDAEGEVEVLHSPEALTITSPGGLVFGVTPDNILTHPSTPRHRRLFEAVSALQLAERTGQGVDRAYRVLLQAGKAPPQFVDEGTRTRVLVDGGVGDATFVRFLRTRLSDEAAADVNVLLAFSVLRTARSVAAPRLAAAMQRTTPEAQAVLAAMHHEWELVEPTKRTATKALPNYRLRPEIVAALGPALAYHVRAPDAEERKVVEHVREYGWVTNATLQRLFDIDLFTARNLLRALQDRGVLIKLDSRAGGRGIRYGPGRTFPGA